MLRQQQKQAEYLDRIAARLGEVGGGGGGGGGGLFGCCMGSKDKDRAPSPSRQPPTRGQYIARD